MIRSNACSPGWASCGLRLAWTANPHGRRRRPGRQNAISCEAAASLASQTPKSIVTYQDLLDELLAMTFLYLQAWRMHLHGVQTSGTRRGGTGALQSCYQQDLHGKCEMKMIARSLEQG